jgi:glucose/arabinose dehydrogenase
MGSKSLALIVAALPALAVAQSGITPGTPSATTKVRTQQLAALEFPWGMAYLPDGRLLITEKPGRLRIYANGTLSPPVDGLPAISYREGMSEQGGLLDVAVDPDFAQNRRIYVSFSEESPQQGKAEPADDDPRFAGNLDLSDNRLRGGAVARATLDGTRLSNVQVIWRQEPKQIGRGHFGHRLVFAPDKTLFITSGERMRFDPAADPKTNLGKVIHINADGSIPKENPFVGRDNARGDVWSYGHRNMLAAAVHPSTGKLWVFEMGPLGGDELNIIEPGRNYGWPVVSDGDNYDKSPIPDHSTRSDFEKPVKTWTPVISPSGALFYDGSLFPWRGHAIVGSLSARGLIRLTLNGNTVASEDRIDLQRRVRDVIQARDGSLLVITDEKMGALLQLTPQTATH